MAGITYADYELVERPGETETTALFKGQHVIIPERLRAIKLAQVESSRMKVTFTADRLKELFGQLCQAAAQVACALDAAPPARRAAAERIGFIEAIHFDADKPADDEAKDYIITEWVGGGTLAERLASGALPVSTTGEILGGVLEGLEYAHAHHIVHGNLKPNNILLTPDGQPKIVDFGGNIIGQGVPPRFGSVPYLSPEQLLVESEPDGRADLFSLTLICYEMLTGRRAPRLLTAAQMPSKLNPQASAAFDDIIIQGLQTDPRMRFRSAQEMRERVLQAVSGPRGVAETSVPVAAAARASEAEPVPETPAVARNGEATGAIEDEQTTTGQEPGSEPSEGAGTAEPDAILTAPSGAAAVATAPASTVVTTVTHRAGERRINEVDGAELVWVPGGQLQMGSDREAQEGPVHPVPVAGFWLYRYPVTQAQYVKYMQYMREKSGPEAAPPRPSLFLRGDAHGNRAAAGISWAEACDYARWAAGRLPTEAEWEWAARGPEGRRYPWGDEWGSGPANVAETGLYTQTEVDRYMSGESWCGALDLLGNVFEWCSSLYQPYPYDATDGREKSDPKGVHTLRGGSATTPADQVYATARWQPSSQTTRMGFRLVKNATE